MKRMGAGLVFAVGLFAVAASGAEETKAPILPAELRPQAEAAQEAFAKGKYRDAATAYEAMRKAAPKNLWVLSNLAVVQFRLGQLKPAEETLREALTIAPGDGFCRRMLGIVFYSQQKYDAAAEELAKAVAIDPKDAEAHLYLAFCAGQAGQSGKAAEEFARAAELNPDYKDKGEISKTPETMRRWPVGDYLTPLERSRLRLPPARLIR